MQSKIAVQIQTVCDKLCVTLKAPQRAFYHTEKVHVHEKFNQLVLISWMVPSSHENL